MAVNNTQIQIQDAQSPAVPPLHVYTLLPAMYPLTLSGTGSLSVSIMYMYPMSLLGTGFLLFSAMYSVSLSCRYMFPVVLYNVSDDTVRNYASIGSLPLQ